MVHRPWGVCIHTLTENGIEREHVVDANSVGQYTGHHSEPTDEYPEGREIYTGDSVYASSVNGIIHGVIKLGLYESIHYGYYIQWKDASSGTRQDLKFWASRLHVEDAL